MVVNATRSAWWYIMHYIYVHRLVAFNFLLRKVRERHVQFNTKNYTYTTYTQRLQKQRAYQIKNILHADKLIPPTKTGHISRERHRHD